MGDDSTSKSPLKPGWYAVLSGEERDLTRWRAGLYAPFDPVALHTRDKSTVLSSKMFAGLSEAAEVRDCALGLIARLNGSMKLWMDAGRVTFGGVLRVDDEGREHRTTFIQGSATFRITGAAVGLTVGPDGQPLPPPPSPPQVWEEMAADSRLADLLAQFGKADDWIEIYKTIEFAGFLCGKKQRLWDVLGTEGERAKALSEAANKYRHARVLRVPPVQFTLEEAQSFLGWIVRTVIERRAESLDPPSEAPG